MGNYLQLLLFCALIVIASSASCPKNFRCTLSFRPITTKLDLEVDSSKLEDNMVKIPWSKLNVPSDFNLGKVAFHFWVDKTHEAMGKFSGFIGNSASGKITKTETYDEDYTSRIPAFLWAIDSTNAKAINFKNDELVLGVVSAEVGTFKIQSIELDRCISGTEHDGSGGSSSGGSSSGGDSGSTTGGKYTLKVNKKVVYSQLDDKMIGFEWDKFEIPSKAVITKVDVNISTTTDKLGKWQGAFGTSTTVSPEYWTMTSDMQETFSGKSGKVTWKIPAATGKIIQTKYGGELKFGIWWIDCGTFTIDSIDVYT